MRTNQMVVLCALLLATLGAHAATPEPQPKVAVDSAMRAQAIDTLVAKLNDHYVFPDKAKQAEAVLRQRQREGKYDGIADGVTAHLKEHGATLLLEDYVKAIKAGSLDRLYVV